MNSKDIIQKLPKAVIAEPFQFALSLVFFLSSINVLAGFGDVRTLRSIGPDDIFYYYWTLSLLVGGLLSLVGMLWGNATQVIRHVILAQWIEKLGLILLGTAMLVYSIVVFSLTGASALIGALLFTVLSLAFFFKILVLNAREQALTSTVKLANEYIQELKSEEEGEEE